MQEWDIDLTEVDGLKRWFKKQPKLMQKASAMLLNNFAFGVRDESVRQIDRLMTVRNPGFVKGRLRVTKTALSTPIAQQRSIAGSVATARFTGWAEQELGKPVERKRISTLASRGGNIANQMKHPTRLKTANNVATFGSQGFGKTPRGLAPSGGPNYGGWIAMLLRQKYKGLIRIGGKFYVLPRTAKAAFVGPGQRGGNYWNQLRMVQETKKDQPRRLPWLSTARKVYFRKNPPQQTWNRTVARLMTPPPKR